MTTQGRPYQGYPYTNPTVFDVPSIDPTTAAKWANLPRKPITPSISGLPKTRDGFSDNKASDKNEKADPSDSLVVYIDMPETNGRQAEMSTSSRTQVPEQDVTSDSSSVEFDPAERPRVYIDLPDEDDSIVSEPGYIRETILYDQFKETRITMPRPEQGSSSCQPRRPAPPVDFNLTSPSSSGYSSQSNYPSLMHKETSVYHRPIPEDDFSLSPIPVNEFPAPPPAYTEVDTRVQPNQSTSEPDAPRTQVIGPNIPQPGSAEDARRRMNCQHCGNNVLTIVELKSGVVTHVTACALLLCCMLPCIPIVYCIDLFKYHNHYCPDCFKLIGYKLPIMSQRIVYVKE